MNYMRRQSIHTSAPSGSSEEHSSHQPLVAKPMRQRVRAQRRSSICGPSTFCPSFSNGTPTRDGTAARMRRRTTLDTLSSVLPSFLPAPKTGEEAAATAGGSFSYCANGVDEIFQQATRERDTTIQSVQENNGYGMYKWREIQSRLVSANIRTNLAAQMVISTIFEESSQNYFRSNLGGATGCRPDDAAATRVHRTSRRFSFPFDFANDSLGEDAVVPADVQTNISCAAFCQRAATSTVKLRSSRHLLGHKGGGGGNKSSEERASSDQHCSDGLFSVIVDSVRDDCARRSSGSGSNDSEGYFYDDNVAPSESKEQRCNEDRFATSIEHCHARPPAQQPDSIPAPTHSLGNARLPEALVQSDLMPQDVTWHHEPRQEQPRIECDGDPPGNDADVCGDEGLLLEFPTSYCDITGVLHTEYAAVSATPGAPNKKGETRGLSDTQMMGGDSCRHDATEGAIDGAFNLDSPVADDNTCDVAITDVASKNDETTTVVTNLTSPLVKFPTAHMYGSATQRLASLEDHNPLHTPLPSTKFRRAQRRHSMVGGGYSISSSMRPRHNVAQTTSSGTAGIIFKSGIDHHPSDGMDVMFIPPSSSSPPAETATPQQSPSGANSNNGRQTGIGTPKRAMRRRNSIIN